MPDSCKRRFNGIGCPDMLPMHGWKVIEGKQPLFIFLKAVACLWVFRLIETNKTLKTLESLLFGRSHVHFMNQALGIPLNRFIPFVKNKVIDLIDIV